MKIDLHEIEELLSNRSFGQLVVEDQNAAIVTPDGEVEDVKHDDSMLIEQLWNAATALVLLARAAEDLAERYDHSPEYDHLGGLHRIIEEYFRPRQYD